MPRLTPIYRFQLVRERSEPYTAPLRTADQVADLARTLLPDDAREHFVCLLLDARNRLTGAVTISVGSLTASLVHPREAFRAAIAAAASAVLFVHNHPSGDPTPSAEDNDLTRRLWEGGKLLGIRVLDHVILGDNTSRHYSFADENALPPG